MAKTSTVDVWTPQVPTEKLHPHFRSIAANPVDRDCFQRWVDNFPDANGNIAHELQTKFSAAFWEIYLFNMFKSLGFGASRPKERPDFILETPSGPLAAEAMIIDAGPDQPPAWTPIEEVPLDREAFYDQTSAKLLGALDRKVKHYRTYSREPAVKDRPFLLCLNPYDTPHCVMQGFGAITRALYQYCDPIPAPAAAGGWNEVGHRRVESFTTKSGTVVPFGFFLDQKNEEVSAVFFNPRATTSKLFADPLRNSHEKELVLAWWYLVASKSLHVSEAHPSNYRETLADGGYLLLNSNAKHPVDAEPFFRQGVTVCTFDGEKRILNSRTPTPFLKTRVTLGVLPDDFPADLMRKGKPAHHVE